MHFTQLKIGLLFINHSVPTTKGRAHSWSETVEVPLISFLICAVLVNNRQPGSLAGIYLAIGHLKVLKTKQTNKQKQTNKKGHFKGIISTGTKQPKS